jgi:hypothetical protein
MCFFLVDRFLVQKTIFLRQVRFAADVSISVEPPKLVPVNRINFDIVQDHQYRMWIEVKQGENPPLIALCGPIEEAILHLLTRLKQYYLAITPRACQNEGIDYQLYLCMSEPHLDHGLIVGE